MGSLGFVRSWPVLFQSEEVYFRETAGLYGAGGGGGCVCGGRGKPRTPGEYDYARSTFTTLLRLMTVSEGQVWGVCDDLLDDEERVGLCESIHVIACQADSLGKRAKRLSEATVVLMEKERERVRLEKHAAPRRSPRATRSQGKAWQPLKHEEAAVRKTRYDTRDEPKAMLTHSKNERREAKKAAAKSMRLKGRQREQDNESTVWRLSCYCAEIIQFSRARQRR